MHSFSDQYQALLSIAVGLVLIFWPPPKRAKQEADRKARLAELARGAPERYFEERRQLEAYGPRMATPFRLLGCLVLLAGMAMLFL